MKTKAKSEKQTVKIMGHTVTVGTKAHAKLVADKKRFDDLSKHETGNASAPTQSPIIIKQGGGASSAIVPVVVVGSLFAGYFFVLKPYLAKRAAGLAEGDTSPEGIIATRFKTVFGERGNKNTYVSDVDYKAAAALLTNDNQKKVYEIYSKLTDRQLSDDIANHISPDVKSKADKIQAYNSKPGKLFSVIDNKVKFEVVPGDFVRFAPGQKTPVTAYFKPFGIILNDLKGNDIYAEFLKKLKSDPKTVPFTVSVPIKPSANAYKITAVKEITWGGVQKAEPFFWKFSRPFVNTKKSFAAIQILVGKDTKGKPNLVWIDGRDMVAYKATSKSEKGIGNVCSKLI